MNKAIFHALTGTAAMLLIACFWSSTVVSELFMSHAVVTEIKRLIVYFGLAPLVLLMALTGAVGRMAARDRQGRLVEQKKKRMLAVSLNGLLVIIPCALYLYGKAATGGFDTGFYLVQALELAAGFTQMILLGLNFREGLTLAGRLRKSAAKEA